MHIGSDLEYDEAVERANALCDAPEGELSKEFDELTDAISAWEKERDLAPVDEFHKHELMDRAAFVAEMLESLENHPAHTVQTRAAFDAAVDALYAFYHDAANERFKAAP